MDSGQPPGGLPVCHLHTDLLRRAVGTGKIAMGGRADFRWGHSSLNFPTGNPKPFAITSVTMET